MKIIAVPAMLDVVVYLCFYVGGTDVVVVNSKTFVQSSGSHVHVGEGDLEH